MKFHKEPSDGLRHYRDKVNFSGNVINEEALHIPGLTPRKKDGMMKHYNLDRKVKLLILSFTLSYLYLGNKKSK